MQSETSEINNRQASWLISLVLFLAIAIIGLSYLLASPTVHVQTANGEDVVKDIPSLSYEGLQLRYKSWTLYPEYNVGMGILAVIGLSGVIYSGIKMSGSEDNHEN